MAICLPTETPIAKISWQGRELETHCHIIYAARVLFYWLLHLLSIPKWSNHPVLYLWPSPVYCCRSDRWSSHMRISVLFWGKLTKSPVIDLIICKISWNSQLQLWTSNSRIWYLVVHKITFHKTLFTRDELSTEQIQIIHNIATNKRLLRLLLLCMKKDSMIILYLMPCQWNTLCGGWIM
jgi:hypothetical protein